MKIIETNRFYLRTFQETDALHLFSLNSDCEVLKYTGDVPFETVDDALEFIKNYRAYLDFGMGRWAVILKENNAFLGWCGLKYNPKTEQVDLGFRFFQKYWNKGYATEAAQACIEYGFTKLKLQKIVGRAMQENKASIQVLTKVGMTYVSTIDFEEHRGALYEIYNL